MLHEVVVGNRRLDFKHKLHEVYAVQAYDNTDVWAGNLGIELDGITFDATMSRAFLTSDGTVEARVRAEIYVADIDLSACGQDDLSARLWTDVNDRGFIDEEGMYHTGLGSYISMHLVVDPMGEPILCGNNLVFESELIQIRQTGVFHYTVEFSAYDPEDLDHPDAWVSVNDIALNKNGVIVIAPENISQGLSITEVCARKVDATLDNQGNFVSGTFNDVTKRLEEMHTDVIYLLPFFEPGFKDVHSGEDVRKGVLGSVYAVKDFYRIDPDLVTPLAKINMAALISEGLVLDSDLQELLDAQKLSKLKTVADFEHFGSVGALADWVGADTLTQLVGRAELRRLTRRAHALGKYVIFDLVLMQTSRDCPLIKQHPEWYVMDEFGRPSIHQIAWLVYSDVALLKLQFNQPLQNYLSGIAPYWMQTCDLDGVRIDASQTVDRPFLKQIKNRINAVKDDAIVLGETLCDLNEAVDIPVDMIYALLVDFHRDAQYASQYVDFLEYTSGTFAPRTVAMAYFENHDSVRATKHWRDHYGALLHANAMASWNDYEVDEAALTMALLRNLQCSLINATAGSAHYTNLAYALEWGSEWGEEVRTDFEESTLLHPEWAQKEPQALLARAYLQLQTFVKKQNELQSGHVYFYRNIDVDDRILAYVRYTSKSGVLVVHNLDPSAEKRVVCPMTDIFDVLQMGAKKIYDTYDMLVENTLDAEVKMLDDGLSIHLQPLQSIVVKLTFCGL